VKFRRLLQILEEQGFELHRRPSGSHRQYRAVIEGRVFSITIAYHNINDEVLPKTLASIIRQSGLPKKLFR
jgi:predicted RNA binding protein YcfA (HicA-like mRNA interferase family)